MIEQIFDERIGIVAATRVYDCPEGPDHRHVRARGTTIWALGINGPHELPEQCYACEQGPVLWDSWRCLPYTLTPFVIMEEPW